MTETTDQKLLYRYFDVVAPGCFQLTDQDGYCVEDEEDDDLAAALGTAYENWRSGR